MAEQRLLDQLINGSITTIDGTITAIQLSRRLFPELDFGRFQRVYTSLADSGSVPAMALAAAAVMTSNDPWLTTAKILGGTVGGVIMTPPAVVFAVKTGGLSLLGIPGGSYVGGELAGETFPAARDAYEYFYDTVIGDPDAAVQRLGPGLFIDEQGRLRNSRGALVSDLKVEYSDAPSANDVLQDAFNGLCFAAGTRVNTSFVDVVNIEQVVVGQNILAFRNANEDSCGALAPARVTQIHKTPDQPVIDFHGTRVTPGHVFAQPDEAWRALGAVLRADGFVVNQAGEIVRARTGEVINRARFELLRATIGPSAVPAFEIAEGRARALRQEIDEKPIYLQGVTTIGERVRPVTCMPMGRPLCQAICRPICSGGWENPAPLATGIRPTRARVFSIRGISAGRPRTDMSCPGRGARRFTTSPSRGVSPPHYSVISPRSPGGLAKVGKLS